MNKIHATLQYLHVQTKSAHHSLASSLWYEALGYRVNPLSIKPIYYDKDSVIGLETTIDAVLNLVRKGRVAFIEGAFGSGKTTLLKRIVSEFGGNRKVIYFSANRVGDSVDFDELLHGVRGFFGKLFKIKTHGAILFVDEAQELGLADQRKLLEYYYLRHFRSIILVGVPGDQMRFIPELEDELDQTFFSLDSLTLEEAEALLHKRFSKKPYFSDAAIARVFSYDSNPRNFLKNCEHVARFSFREGIPLIEADDVKRAMKAL